MNVTQLKTLIKYLQCKHSKFANIVASKLSLGVCSEEYLNKLTKSSYILEIFYRYNPQADDEDFDEEVLNAKNCLTVCQMSALKDKFLLLIK